MKGAKAVSMNELNRLNADREREAAFALGVVALARPAWAVAQCDHVESEANKRRSGEFASTGLCFFVGIFADG